VADHALGDVGHRQVGDEPLARVGLEVNASREALHGPGHVLVREHHALGRAGGPRGVDQRGQVLGLGDGGGFRQVDGVGPQQVLVGEDVVGCQAVGVPQDAQVLERRELVAHLEERLEEADVLDHPQVRLAMTDEVGDLVRRGRVVDGDRRAPAEVGGHVQDVELRDVAQHEHDPCAPPDPAGLQAAGRGGHPLGVLREGPLAPRVVLVAPPQGDLVAQLACGPHEHGRDRLTLHHGLDVGARRHRLVPPRVAWRRSRHPRT